MFALRWIEGKFGKTIKTLVTVVTSAAGLVVALYGAWEVYHNLLVEARLAVDPLNKRGVITHFEGRPPVRQGPDQGPVYIEGVKVQLRMRHDGGSDDHILISGIEVDADFMPGRHEQLAYSIPEGIIPRPLGGIREIPTYSVLLEGAKPRAEHILADSTRRPVPAGNLLQSKPTASTITLEPNERYTVQLGFEAVETGLYRIEIRIHASSEDEPIDLGPFEIYYED